MSSRQRHHIVTRLFMGVMALLIIFVTDHQIFVSPPAEAVLITPLNSKRPKDFAITRKDGVWHIFGIYCTSGDPNCQTPYPGLMHLTSTDLTTWVEVGYVVAPGTSGTWDAEQTWAPSIVERNGTYYMFYAALSGPNGSGNKEQKIGLATSTDLYTWTKHPGNPVINCDNFTWVYWDPTDSTGVQCRDPFVMWDENEHQWVMFLTSRSTDSSPLQNPGAVGFATSEDLVTWREGGYIPTTNDYTAESPHVFTHNGTYYLFITDNADGGQVLSYLTSSNLYTGWSAQANIPNMSSSEYATEYLSDGGREYLARIATSNTQYDIDEITWPSNVFTPQEISYATIGDYVWADTDADGIFDGGESGINSVTVRLYLDNGDGVFNLSTDDLYSTATTGDDPNTAGTQTGYYRFNKTIPGSYWLYIDPANYGSGGALAGKVNTSNNTLVGLTMTDSQSALTHDIGFKTADTTWALTTSANFTAGSGASVANGQGSIASTSASASPTWWNTDWHDRKQVTVTAGAENLTTDDTIILAENLATLVSAGKLQADYDDLRLIYWNGSVNSEVDLDIVSSTVQRFKLQANVNAGTNSTAYYLYYGSSGALKRPTWLANVYEYYSSFNAKDGTTYGSWAESDSDTNWAISANKWRYNATTGADRFTRDTSKTIDLSQDWSIEAGMTINSGAVGGLSFIRTETFDEDKYWLNFDATNDWTQFWQGSIGQLGSNDSATINTATNYIVRFDYFYNSSASRSLHAALNNVTEHSTTQSGLLYDIWKNDGAYPSNLKSAHLGLNAFNANVSFNDVKAWQLHDGNAALGSEVNLHPDAVPTIQPVSGGIVPFAKLESFSASSADQGGSVGFVLSNDGGTTWLYWNGSAWTTSNSSLAQSNTVATINAQAASFPMGGEQFLWQAVLSSTSNDAPLVLHAGASLNQRSVAPTLSGPADGATLIATQPTFQFSTTDPESESLVYELQLDTSSSFDSANLTTIAQSSSLYSWHNMDSDAGQRYASGTTASHVQPTSLSSATWYWRVRAIDPDGSNIASQYSATRSFVVPPTLSISAVTAQPTDSTTTVVSWTTSNATTGQVNYGSTTAYGSTATSSAGSSTSHSVTITGLQANSTYHFQATGTDAYGQTISSPDVSVTTLQAVFSSSQAVISNIKVSTIRTTSAVITWTTSSAMQTALQYGPSHEKLVTSANTASGTSHSITLQKLQGASRYHFYVTTANGGTILSADQHFSTLGFAVAPTLRTARVRSLTKQLVVTGWARGRQTITLFIDGKRFTTVKTTGRSDRIYSFTKTFSIATVKKGTHRLNAQSFDHLNRLSHVRQFLLFRVR